MYCKSAHHVTGEFIIINMKLQIS